MTATTLEMTETEVPQDDAPDVELPKGAGPFTDLYPDSTPEAPYGRKPDGTPYKRHHGGRGKGASTPGKMPASESLARSAAGLLASVNNLTAIALMAGNLPLTAEALQNGNKQFEEMAYNALLADPALCKRILSAGASGGKAGLVMAYAMLTMSIFPAAKVEIQERRNRELPDE